MAAWWVQEIWVAVERDRVSLIERVVRPQVRGSLGPRFVRPPVVVYKGVAVGVIEGVSDARGRGGRGGRDHTTGGDRRRALEAEEQGLVDVAVPSQLGSSSEVDQVVVVSPSGFVSEVSFPAES